MTNFKMALCMVIIATSVLVCTGQDTAADKSPAKTPPPANTPPVSQYMRESALTYAGTIDKMFDQAVQDHIQFMNPAHTIPVDPDENVYGNALKDLEERIEINITSNVDKQFLELLERTKSMATITFFEILRTSDPKYKRMPPHLSMGTFANRRTGTASPHRSSQKESDRSLPMYSASRASGLRTPPLSR